jgi:hypothetical protein
MSLQKLNVQTHHQTSVVSTVDYFEKEMKELMTDIDNRDIYKIYKPPASLKFIRKNDIAQKILFELKPLVSYDKSSLILIIIHLEYFLQYHYYIMTERYKDIDVYLPIIKDIRKELLNLSKGVVMNSPVLFKKTFDKLQDFTFAYILELLHHKI